MPEESDNIGPLLIIDDEEIILELTAIILRNHGFDVHTSIDPVAGLEMMESLRPELVLLDYMMPGMDGLAVLKEIRRRFPDTYVMMFTGKGNEEVAVELMKAGASDYVLKPFSNRNLVERIDNVLRIRKIELKNRDLLREREVLLAEIAAWNRELEVRVEEKTRALQKAQGEIAQAEKLATLGYLSAGMAHEIRNPLNSIALFVQLLRSGIEDPEKAEYINKSLKEIDRIDDILQKLLDAARRPEFAIDEVSINNVIDTTLEVFRPQLEHHKIEVVRDYRRIPPAIQANALEIEQIFTNLFLNAIQEMPYQGKLGVQLDHDGGKMTIRVSDSGMGIPDELVPRIFEPFFTTKKSGIGMGLAVVLRIVKIYNGNIEVEKSDEFGTTFCICFPIST
ncbi:MAG TPA: response regulator [Geobacteraceae bacterium]